MTAFDSSVFRKNFPLLAGLPGLSYLDNAATTQKPRSVIAEVTRFYESENANIHRGLYPLGVRASQRYEQVRTQASRFIGACRPEEIVFVRGATEGINLVAWSFLRPKLTRGDRVLISAMEHHANIVPWQQVCEATGAELDIIPLLPDGSLDMSAFHDLLTDRTRMLAMVHISNSLGTVNPVEELIAAAHAKGVPVLIDAAQSAALYELDVQSMDCDFLVCSAHKMFGPTGLGMLYGRYEYLEEMPPYQTGGDMIRSVTFERTTFAPPPHRFEAGTPHIAGVAGFGSALDLLRGMDRPAARSWLDELRKYGTHELQRIEGLTIVGTAEPSSAILSFVLEGVHPHDLATICGEHGVAIRAGHHCTQPALKALGYPATARASLAPYNDRSDIDRLAEAIRAAKALFEPS